MKKISSLLLCLFSTCVLGNRSKLITPYFSMRSQALSSARELVGWASYINLPDQCEVYGAGAATVEYSRSWRPRLVANWLFGRDLMQGCDEDHLVISGSLVPERNAQKDWLADYFGLPTDFVSHLYFMPQVDNTLLDFNLYVGLDNWYPGIYFRMHGPFVHTRRRLGMKEVILNPGQNNYRAGYFTPSEVPRENLLNSFEEFAACCQAPDLPDDVMFEPLNFARFTTNKWLTKTSFAEIEVALGWNFLIDDDYHLGVNLRAAAPAGTKPEGIYLFEPIVGNGHQWIVGGGLTMHVNVWRDVCETKSLNAYLDANLYHFLSNKQLRFFDIRNKNNSRYMLAQCFNLPIDGDLRGSEDMGLSFRVPESQFKNVYAPVANVTTVPVEVKTKFQADVTVMAQYQNKCISWDFGYNFWYRSCEEVDLDPACLPQQLVQKKWVLKGDAQLFGFDIDDATPVALSASQSEADIHTGLNFGPGKDVNKGIANGGADPDDQRTIDNPIPAFSDSDTLVSQPGGVAQTNTSIPPLFIRPSSLDICSVSTASTIHTLFTHINYEGQQRYSLIPFIGIGGRISCAFQDNNPFKQVNVSRCQNACSQSQCVSCRPCLKECLSCGICEWGVWIKGGIAY